MRGWRGEGVGDVCAIMRAREAMHERRIATENIAREKENALFLNAMMSYLAFSQRRGSDRRDANRSNLKSPR